MTSIKKELLHFVDACPDPLDIIDHSDITCDTLWPNKRKQAPTCWKRCRPRSGRMPLPGEGPGQLTLRAQWQAMADGRREAGCTWTRWHGGQNIQ